MRLTTLQYCGAIAVTCILCYACGSGRADVNLQQIIGHQIAVPDSMRCTAAGRDTILSSKGTLALAKVLVYYNAAGCTPCKIKELPIWHNLRSEISDSATEFLYVLNTANASIRELGLTLETFHFDHPVFYDNLGDFERLNPSLPKNPVFHTFLLDRNNRVVLVGSPVGNPKMWSLYKETIQKLAASGGQLKSSDHTSPLRNLTPQIEKNAYSWSKEKP